VSYSGGDVGGAGRVQDGLSASGRVVHNYATGFEDLADFFQKQADDWRGWAGTRRWESLEGDLEVEARHLYVMCNWESPCGGFGPTGVTTAGRPPVISRSSPVSN
jgi:hypothetical protein